MLKERLLSFKWAFKGIVDLFKSQPNAQIHLLAIIVVVSAGFYFHLSTNEWLVIILVIGLVISMEAMNTALEYLTDLVSPDHHPLAGKAKDAAAGAVLLSAITAVSVALVIFGPKVAAVLH